MRKRPALLECLGTPILCCSNATPRLALKAGGVPCGQPAIHDVVVAHQGRLPARGFLRNVGRVPAEMRRQTGKLKNKTSQAATRRVGCRCEGSRVWPIAPLLVLHLPNGLRGKTGCWQGMNRHYILAAACRTHAALNDGASESATEIITLLAGLSSPLPAWRQRQTRPGKQQAHLRQLVQAVREEERGIGCEGLPRREVVEALLAARVLRKGGRREGKPRFEMSRAAAGQPAR